jgi:hypothetical protein
MGEAARPAFPGRKIMSEWTSPATFEPGADYFLRENRSTNGHHNGYAIVRLVKYDPCPAWVIVRDADGRRRRCPREDLFLQIEEA